MIRDLGASGVTVLVSSHILAEIEQVSDSVTIVRRGQLIASGLVSDVVGGSAASSLRVRVADLAAAHRILSENAMTSTIAEDHLMVGGAADGSQVTRLLAQHDLYVNELTPVQPDLESVFLDLTRDEVTGVGTSFVGADFASGSLSNTLLFRPNRWQVWLAKIAATGLWLTLVAAITVVLCLGALAIVGANVDGTQPTSDQLATLTKRGVAIMTVVVAAGVLGAALTTALRATIATAGIVIGYLLVGEALLRGLADEEVTPWLASTRINALVTSPLRLFSYNEATGEEKVTLLYLWPSAAYLGVLFAIVLALCAVVFARRDVP
jgi:hypothetical protein